MKEEMSAPKVKVYSALFGDVGYTRFQQWKRPAFDLHTSEGVMGTDWNIKPFNDQGLIEMFNGDMVRIAKHHKMNPKIFVHEEIRIWCDANICLTERMEELMPLMDECDILFFSHYGWDCVYTELEKAIALNKIADVEQAFAQVERYRQEGLPEHFGMPACGVIVSRDTEKVREFFQIWEEEIANGSARDQLSVTYALWKSGVNYKLTDVDNAAGGFANEFRKMTPKGRETPILDLLSEYANKWNADKGPICHNYTQQYHDYFKDIRADMKTVLEVGIWDCASMFMWQEYFPNANIYGMDIIIKRFPDLPRTRAFQGDAANAVHVAELMQMIGTQPDLIVDDGSHKMFDQQETLKLMFPHLKPGGMYIIEDVQGSFTWDVGYGVRKDGRNSTYNLARYLARPPEFDVDPFEPEITLEEADVIADQIERMEVIQISRNKVVHPQVGSIAVVIWKKDSIVKELDADNDSATVQLS